MVAIQIVISAFADLDFVEVVGHGGVAPPTGTAQEVEIVILVAAIDAAGAFGPARGRRIGCGQFDLVPVGSRWSYGRAAGRRKLERHSAPVSIQGRELLGLRIADPRGSGSERLEMPTELHALAPCFKLSVEGTKDARGRLSPPMGIVIVSVMEMLRALFGVSDVFLKQMFDGIRDRESTPGHHLFDREVSRRLDDGRTIRLRCDRELDPAEAVVAASMVASARVMSSHDAVNRNLRASPGWWGQQQSYADTSWPFDDVRLDFEGGWMLRAPASSRPDRRFVITRILGMKPRRDFNRIEMDYPESRTTTDGPPVENPGARVDRSPTRRTTRGIAPSPDRKPTTVRSGSSEVESEGIELVRCPREGRGSPRSPIRGGREDPETNLLSTADVESGGDPQVAKLNVGRKRRDEENLKLAKEVASREAAESRARTLTAVYELGAAHGWPVTELSVRANAVTRLVAAGASAAVEIVMCGLTVDVKTVLVVDAGTAKSDPRSLGVIARIGRDAGMPDIRAVAEAAQGARGRWLGSGVSVEGCVVRGYVRRGSLGDDDYRAVVERAIRSTLKAAQR